MIDEYPPSFVNSIKAMDGIILLAGLCLLAYPPALGFYPGAFDTMVHVTLGALISVCAVFRVLVAYGSAWLEVVLCVLGVLAIFLPTFMHMRWEPRYNTIHLVLGAVVIILSVISGAITFARLAKDRRALA